MTQVECAQTRQYQQPLNEMPFERIMSNAMVLVNGVEPDKKLTGWNDECRRMLCRLAAYRGAVGWGIYTDYPQEGR